MKLHLTQAEGNQLITAYEAGTLSIHHQRYEHSLIVLATEAIKDRLVTDFEALSSEHFDGISESVSLKWCS